MTVLLMCLLEVSMIYRRLDVNGDYVFGRGKHDYVSGVEAVAQAIKTRLLLLYQEWWEDKEDGLPLFERILGASGNTNNIKAVDYIFKERIQNTTGVLSLLGYDSYYDNNNRKYIFIASVETLYGELVISNTELEETA